MLQNILELSVTYFNFGSIHPSVPKTKTYKSTNKQTLKLTCDLIYICVLAPLSHRLYTYKAKVS